MTTPQDSALHLTLADPDPWFIEQKIFDLLSSYLQPNPTLSSTAAARSFDNLLPSHRGPNPNGNDKEDVATFIWNAWEAVHRIAAQVPYSNSTAHKHLANFLVALKNTTSDPAEVILPNWGTKPYAFWGDLPNFGPTLREVVDLVRPGSNEDRNLNVYLAHVLRDGTADMSFFAVLAIDRAVGLHLDYGKLQKKGKPATGLKFTADRTSFEIAQTWIEVAGEAIWKACENNKQKDVELSNDATEWKSEDGVFPKRWHFWLERYGEFMDSQSVNEGSFVSQGMRDTAESPKRLMEEIQS